MQLSKLVNDVTASDRRCPDIGPYPDPTHVIQPLPGIDWGYLSNVIMVCLSVIQTLSVLGLYLASGPQFIKNIIPLFMANVGQ